MRKIILVVAAFLVFVPMVGAVNLGSIKPEEVSIKAGPTQPGEKLNFLWLEAFAFPKEVKQNRLLSLGVRLTTKVKSVTATFDFDNKNIALDSSDGLDWAAQYIVPDGVANGWHVIKYQIANDKKEIQRTVEFFLNTEIKLAANPLAQKVVEDEQAWPLTLTTTAAALVVGGGSRTLQPGELVVGVSKMPWYEVVFADGKTGWVAAADVEEPLEEYCALGYDAYCAQDYPNAIAYYKNTVAINPKFVKGYYWLAKSYLKAGNLDAAYQNIAKAMELDKRDLDAKVFASLLAKQYFDIAQAKYKEQRFHEAIAAYQKVVDLKPSSTVSLIEMGQGYEQLGFVKEARDAWKTALRNEPENKEIYALLKIDNLAGQVEYQAVANVSPELPKVAKKVPAALADDSVAIVKSARTKKGTSVDTAIKSVITLTKSLGNPVAEKGWQIAKKGKAVLVQYVCEQERGALESFEWLVDVDTKQVSANNDNARLIMNRW